jgi:hypothetical protein
MKLDELKTLLKAAGMTQAGDKGTLVWRLKLLDTCNKKKLVDAAFSKNPCSLKIAELRTASAREGLSPIGNQDELLGELVKHLEKKAPSAAPASSASKGVDGQGKAQANSGGGGSGTEADGSGIDAIAGNINCCAIVPMENLYLYF